MGGRYWRVRAGSAMLVVASVGSALALDSSPVAAAPFAFATSESCDPAGPELGSVSVYVDNDASVENTFTVTVGAASKTVTVPADGARVVGFAVAAGTQSLSLDGVAQGSFVITDCPVPFDLSISATLCGTVLSGQVTSDPHHDFLVAYYDVFDWGGGTDLGVAPDGSFHVALPEVYEEVGIDANASYGGESDEVHLRVVQGEGCAPVDPGPPDPPAPSATIGSITRDGCRVTIPVTASAAGTFRLRVWDDGVVVDEIVWTVTGPATVSHAWIITEPAGEQAPGVGIYVDSPGGGGLAGVDPWEYPAMVADSCAFSGEPTLIVTGLTGPVAPGDELELNGRGFWPGEEVTITLHSDPVLLATVTANDDGTVAATVQVPADAEAGAHSLVLVGLSSAFTVSTPLTVEVSGVGPVAAVPDESPSIGAPSPADPGADGAGESPSNLAPSGDPRTLPVTR